MQACQVTGDVFKKKCESKDKELQGLGICAAY